MSNERFRLIVGLGNPGDAYRKTRHNAGFMVVEALSKDFSIPLDKTKFDARYGRGAIQGDEVLLAKPLAFMNRSGPPVQSLANYFRISSGQVLIIHDDIDLAFERLKIKEKGGHGGHNGVRSLMEAFGTGDFARLRIGVGRSETGISVTDYVLGKFNSEEEEMLNHVVKRARDAVVTIIGKGIRAGMNQFN
jgi:PTH1 family peptidyl-tRNA hydrolase